ncbi:MAG: co-chaperone GroES [Candidatus Pacebacteria bacterium]|nr:co-chaperone GroES [Candidatus Paceibacterota bacterium]
MAKDTKNKLDIKLLSDRVLVELPPREEMTKSGIIIPETVKGEKPEEGVVVAVGEGRQLESGERAPMTVKVGDRVVFSKYGLDEVSINEKEYYILREENILAVIK